MEFNGLMALSIQVRTTNEQELVGKTTAKMDMVMVVVVNTHYYHYYLKLVMESQVDSAFYLPWDGKKSSSQTAVMLCGWEGNRRPGGK